MKTRFLIAMAFMLVAVFGMFMVSTVIAVTCYDLNSGDCTTNDYCYDRCTPSCTSGRSSFKVDKCCPRTAGYYTCEAHPTNKVSCYITYDCYNSTRTCPSDEAEKECGTVLDYTFHKTSQKILSGSGCD